LELLVPVCQAIQHAHQKGIIHRDIKPTNILVAEYDQLPVPKVIDFGVAKATSQSLTEMTMFTGLCQIVGTLEYMSPEQAKVNQLDIDTRSDIYSLGVLLYELLTGSTPFDKTRLRSAALDEVLRIIREEEPPKPSTRLSDHGRSHGAGGTRVANSLGSPAPAELAEPTLASIAAVRSTEPAKLTKLVRGELDWIVMKALEKDRKRRYETANALAADMLRYLAGEQVLAVPPSATYRLSKFVSRHRAGVVVASAFVLLLLAAATISTVQAAVATRAKVEADRQRQVADQARVAADQARDAARLAEELQRQSRLSAESNLYCAEMNLADQALADPRGLRRVVELINHWQPQAARRDLRGWEWYYLQTICHPDAITMKFFWPSVAKWSPDGKLIAVAELNQTTIRNAATRKQIRKLAEPVGRLIDLAWDPAGRRLATVSTEGQVCVWEVSTGDRLATLAKLTGEAHGIAWSPDGTRIVTTEATPGHSTVSLWLAADATQVWRTEHGQMIHPFRCAFSPSGEFISAGNLILGAEDGTVRQRVPVKVTGRMDWSSDSQRLALPTGKTVDIVEITSGKQLNQIQGHVDTVLATAWSPDQQLLALASWDNTITIWDWQKDELVVKMRGHLDRVDDLCWKRDGSQLATVSRREGVVRLWSIPAAPTPTTLNVGTYATSLRWNREGTRLACLSGAGLRIFGADVERATFVSPPWPGTFAAGDCRVAWSPQGTRLAACKANTVVVMDDKGQELCRLPDQAKPLHAVAWNPRGDRLLATSNPGGGAGGIWVEANADTGAITASPTGDVERYHFGHAVVYSPDGQRFVTSGWAGIRVWDAGSKQVVGQCSDYMFGWVNSVGWSPDGKSIAFACNDRSIRIVDATHYKLQHSLLGHSAEVNSISWSADGRRLASASQDHTLIIWDAELARQLLTLRGHHSEVMCVTWSSDGNRLASLDRDGNLNVWDATPALLTEADQE
jgi:WD40 repeat protein